MYNLRCKRRASGTAIRTIGLLFFTLVSGALGQPAPLQLSPDIHALAISAVNNIYSDRYREAEEDARKIIKKCPAHPAGYFFLAAAIDSWMALHFTDSREDEFYRYCELAVDKGEKMLDKDPADDLARFFVGGAEGYKGTYEARYERWITAFRYGWKGVSQLMQLRDRNSRLPDLDYGIGSYEYWRSALMKSLWWMPGVEDKRATAIEKLKRVRESGIYSKVAASAALVDILENEHRYAEAIAIADQALLQFPGSRLFLIGKGESLLGEGNYAAAGDVFREILSKAQAADPQEERAALAYCHFWIAKSCLGQKRFAECVAECDLMKNFQSDDNSKKLLEKYFDEVEKIKKQAVTARKTAGENTVAGK